MTEKQFNIEFKDNGVVASYDGDKDGKNSAEIKLDLKEAAGEIFSKGEAKVDAVLTLKNENGKIIISVDTDKDGEPSLELSLDIIEGLKEATK